MNNLKYLIIAAIIMTNACTPTITQRGNFISKDKLETINIGEQTRTQVIKALGSPSTKDTLGKETWYYVGSKQEIFAFYEPKEIKRQIIAISFDDDGIVSKIKQLGKKDGKDIYISKEETPTSGHNLGFIEQVVGNVGRFKNRKK
jgi:outer membrane protein assembly factor BamE (lipoprotein component of BamABCDE complex)